MTRKTRVLFISHAYVVGVNQGKLKAIADTEEVELALLAPSNWKALEWDRFLELEAPYPKISIYSAPVWFTGRVGAHIYNPWKVWQVINDFQPDLIQLEEEIFSLCALEVAFWSKIARKPMVVFGWENQQRSLPLPRQWVRDFVMNATNLYIAGNQDGATVLSNWNYPGKIEVMPQMGVDTKLFTPQTVKNQKLQYNQFNIGFLGRLVPEKGIDILFAAVSQLRKQDLKCQITICGSGTSEVQLRREAAKHQIEDIVIWKGAIRHQEAPTELAKFDVLVLPSRTIDTWKEQFGHVIIEAMAMGIPVIGSNCGEIPNVIANSALIFPEEDSKTLAAILKRAISDRSWLEEMGNYGIERVNKHYSHERIATRLIDLWQKTISNLN
ncbi:MAG: glycosyltransferase [Mastigocoleus sp.]